jgi:hypothetical protein
MKYSIVSLIKLLRSKNKILLVITVLISMNSFAQTDDSLRINYNYINSSPQDAEVFLGDELIGRTPLFFTWQDSVFPRQIKISKSGYIEFTEKINELQKLYREINLIPEKGKNLPNPVKEDKGTYFKSPRKIIPIVISSAAAIGAGISAFYFKKLAIENRNIYDDTGDTDALDRKKKYDLYSGISLVVFQAGLGALLYYLLID